ncbi:TetR/AcrR family transcriptional regulator [Cellulomonas soli]|uniref:TetR family transcriptional regulator n=1 Tax=Cellulomonas soli TaxID=931535 RepID=A0A512P8N2_9CELL|nr:TetR/AcrR family transcriptional regulator [Cellulomonas soli]NYI57711.1 AcrR family transcriptional regulator [Cellulomonas soli]GEP67492.1 TetR family transcriptional regulator [Cellulomonas soli]
MGERQDAVRNRARLVAAAEDVFREQGAAAALEQVAARAGVGRATLYRHFPDRAALVAAVYTHRVSALAAHVAALPAPTRLVHLVVEISELQLDTPGLLTVLRTAPDGSARLTEIGGRARALLGSALTAARAHGTIREDVTLEDVLLTFAMVEGVIALEPSTSAPTAVRRAVQLTLRGLLTEEAARAPLPRGVGTEHRHVVRSGHL